VKKQSLLIILALILITISAYFAIYKKSGTELTEFDLQLEDTSEITGFTVESNSLKVQVEKKASDWMVDKTYHANNQLIKRLFRIFKNLNISILARKDSMDVHIQNLKDNGTRLQFLKDQDILATYWIGDYNASKNATLLMNNAELPAYVTAPGLSSNIAKFILADDIFWRDKRIFDFEPEEISKIELTDYQNLNASFVVIINENYQLLNNTKNKVKFEESKIARYLSYFKGVRFESLEEKFQVLKLDSVINQKPLYEINLYAREYGNLNLQLLPKADSLNKREPDLNYVYGLINNKTPLIIISYFAIDPLLKEIDYFRPDSN